MRCIAMVLLLAITRPSAGTSRANGEPETVRPVAHVSGVLDDTNDIRQVSLGVRGTGDFQTYVLAVGSSAVEARFFAADGDLPQVALVSINEKQHLIQVRLPAPSECQYVFYVFSQGRLSVAGKLASHGCIYQPQVVDGDRLAMESWAGFWKKMDVYALERHRLIRRTGRYYAVGVAGTAKVSIALCDAAGCQRPKLRVPAGTKVEIVMYDAATRAYALKTPLGIIGWMKESQVQTDLADLPWAG